MAEQVFRQSRALNKPNIDLWNLAIGLVKDKNYPSAYTISRLAAYHLRGDAECRKNIGFFQILSVSSYFLGNHLEAYYWAETSRKYGGNPDQDLGQIHDGLAKYRSPCKIQLLCNWNPDLSLEWAPLLDGSPHKWSNQTNDDYTVVINATSEPIGELHTLVYRMEPHMERDDKQWGKWSQPNSSNFLHVQTHQNGTNLGEWWLGGLTAQQLLSMDFSNQKTKEISAVVSGKYNDPGHKLRIDFLRTYEKNLPIEIFGNSNRFNFEKYQGELPHKDKRNGVIPFKYHIAVENQSIKNYFTEKVIDALMVGCLVFYWGCPNISEFFGDAVIPVDFSHPERALEQIQTAMKNDEWGKRKNAIQSAREKIVSKLCVRARIENDIQQIRYRKDYPELAHALQLGVPLRTEDVLRPIFQHLSIPTTETGSGPGVWWNPPQDLLKVFPSYRVGHLTFIHEKNEKDDYHLPFSARVVNLDRRPDRWEEFRSQVPPELSYERFPAVDGSVIDMTDKLKHLFRNNDFGFRQGVVGCALSHLELWKRLVNSGQEMCLILEDDVEFAPSFALKLEEILKTAPPFWDLLFLGHHLQKQFITDHRDPEKLPTWENMLDYSVPQRKSWVGTFAYLVSREGAQKLIEFVETQGIQHGVDYLMQLRFPHVSAYGCRPMLVYSEYVQPGKSVDTDIQFNHKAVGEN